MKYLLLIIFTAIAVTSMAQPATYLQKKAEQLAGVSPFQDEIDGQSPGPILYQDKKVIAFNSDAPQMPVHVLIIPKKRIATLNDLKKSDHKILLKMMETARKIAKDLGIAETGYRLTINTNEDAGQSVFHIHLHLLGGHKTGPMVDQTWRNKSDKPSAAYLKDQQNVEKAFGEYYLAWLSNSESAVMNTLASDAVIMPQGLSPKKGLDEIWAFWFPKDGSKTTIKKFDYSIEELKVDQNTAFVRSSSVLSFTYEKDGQTTTRNDQKQVHMTFMERDTDGQWKVKCKMWSTVN
jgi:histidine triad (HIT) family protein